MASRNAVAEFNYYLDAATSPKQENGHFAVNKLCWMIDEAIIKPDDAIQAIHGKIIEENPKIVLHALEVLNTVFYKCGNLAHKVICTEFYMSLLKEIIQTTDDKNIKETILSILKEWAEKFKYFPQYSAPQKLLEELNEVPKSTNNTYENRDTNRIYQASFKQNNDFPKESTEKYEKNRLNKSDIDLIKSTRNESSLNNQSADAEFKEREAEFKKSLREYQQKRKIDYNNYRKSNGLPPLSSDEEDDDSKKEPKNCGSKKEEACLKLRPALSTLPKDLQQVKDQRERLNSDIQQLRNCKHNDYMQSNNGAPKDIQQCKDKNCPNCEKFKSKDEQEESRIPKRFPHEIRKIIESKERMKKNIEDIKKRKQEAYYNKNKSLPSFTNNDEKMEIDAYELIDNESEDDEFQRVILLSKKEMVSNSATAEIEQKNEVLKNTPTLGELEEAEILEAVLAASKLEAEASKINSTTAQQKRITNAIKNTPSTEIDEEKILEEVLAASALDAGTSKIDSTTEEQKRTNANKITPTLREMDEEKLLQQVIALSKLDVETEDMDENTLLQQAINRSFAEEEEKNFSPMPKVSEAELIDYVKKMSLGETHISQSKNEEHASDVKNLSLCLICYDLKITQQFTPCNHKCICKECAVKYIKESYRCLLCYKPYTSIIDSFKI